MFGENFERFVPDSDANPTAAPSVPDGPAKPADKAKKGKVAAKATGLQYQFQIMESMGVPREEIKKFADPYYWLKYYPPICIVSVRSYIFARLVHRALDRTFWTHGTCPKRLGSPRSVSVFSLWPPSGQDYACPAVSSRAGPTRPYNRLQQLALRTAASIAPACPARTSLLTPDRSYVYRRTSPSTFHSVVFPFWSQQGKDYSSTFDASLGGSVTVAVDMLPYFRLRVLRTFSGTVSASMRCTHGIYDIDIV